jgi:ribulose-5-phosphate 4-epimerase/fuculose-1-phosphate aldolase
MLETVCEIFKEAYKRGWITARDGNASVRYAEQDYFYITPSGVRKQFMQPEMFKKIGIVEGVYGQPPVLDYTHEILDYTDVSANLKPSGEFPMHFGLQKQIVKPVRVVLHMHPTYTVAAMYKGINLQNLLNEFPELSRYTSIAPTVPEIEPITQELADATIKNLEVYEGYVKYDIVGYDRHGVVAVDTSPWRAFEHIERLEHICKIVLAAS